MCCRPLYFFWTINKLLRIFCSVKPDEGNDGSASPLSRHLTYIACSLRKVPIRSMQPVLVANKKRLVQGCKNAVAHSLPKTWSAPTVFYLFYFMHMNAVWQSLYVCATKNCCALLTFTENFAPNFAQNFAPIWRPQSAAPGGRCPPLPPTSLRHWSAEQLYLPPIGNICKSYRCDESCRRHFRINLTCLRRVLSSGYCLDFGICQV